MFWKKKPKPNEIVANKIKSAFSDKDIIKLIRESGEKYSQFIKVILNNKKNGFSVHFIGKDLERPLSPSSMPMEKENPYIEVKFKIDSKGRIFSETKNECSILESRHPFVMDIIQECEEYEEKTVVEPKSKPKS
jgi:hypothetical protein